MPAKKPKDERKDKIIQTRVNEALDDRLKREAKRRRLPVSQLIRNLLEDSFELVGNVVDNVDAMAQSAIGLGKQAGADAQRLARRASGAGPETAAGSDPATTSTDPTQEATTSEGATSSLASAAHRHSGASPDGDLLPEPEHDPVAGVLAWQEVVLNAACACALCRTQLERGSAGFLGLNATPGELTWLCTDCRDTLG